MRFDIYWGIAVLTALAAGLTSAAALADEPALSAGTNALTLEAAVQIALASNPELIAGRAQVQSAAGRAYQARLWSNPELEFNTEDWAVGRERWDSAKNTVGAGQVLPFPGKKRLDRDMGAVDVRLSQAELWEQQLQVVRDVKAAFFGVLAAVRLVEVGEQLASVAESGAATAKKRVEAGAGTVQEQLRAEIQAEQAGMETMAFKREQKLARENLASLLGRPDLADRPVAGTLAESADLNLVETDGKPWLARHPSVVAARAVRDRSELAVRRARLEPYPDVRVGLAGGREDEAGNSILEFRVSVPVPIIDRGKGKKQEAAANLARAEAQLAAVEQRLLRVWSVASARLRTAAEQVSSYRERILPKTDEALHLVRTGFEEGKFGFIDLLDTQRTAAEARLAYQRRLLELNVAQAELELLLGVGPVIADPGVSQGTQTK